MASMKQTKVKEKDNDLCSKVNKKNPIKNQDKKKPNEKKKC